MSLRYALLGLTAAFPSTGYELARIFDRSLDYAWHASHSQIYPELKRLSDEGLVEVVGEGARNSKSFAATAAGRQVLREWLVETEPVRKVRDESSLRLFLTSLLEPADRLTVLRRELAHLEAHMEELDRLAKETASRATPSAFASMIDLGQRVMPVTRGWLLDAIAQAESGLPDALT
ncbi:MAG: PadR family transcriptional regulator [Solirubrobacteraceae bacterium]|nr:PadR family transcriptional regulator [Patulibacter sp.]